MPKFHKIDDKRNDMFVTGSVSSDDKTTREKYRKLTPTLIKSFDYLKTKFDIEKDCILFIRNLRTSLGQFRPSSKEIIIDIRHHSLQQIISTMIHEFTHAQQYRKGDLVEHPSNKKLCIYKNEEFKRVKSTVDYEAYRNQPWEIEARLFESKMIEKTCKDLNIKFDEKLVK